MMIGNGDNKFEGTFKEENEYSNGKCFCELFTNTKSYFVYGKWIEYSDTFKDGYTSTWWAKIDRK
jgi:hypothetical protein